VLLYLGTFGSFIGYAAGFPLLIKSQFPASTRWPTPGWARWWAR
jgi:nitrate/nitrite transporter NarK